MRIFFSVCIAMAAFLAAVSASHAPVTDPVPGVVPLGDKSVIVQFLVQLPDSGPDAKPGARPMTLIGDGTGRRFIADQNGLIYQLHADLSISVFLDLSTSDDFLANQGQKGLSSFAFHPDFTELGAPGFNKVYTASSQVSSSGAPDYPVPPGASTTHHSVIHEWDIDPFNPDAVDATSAREVLRIGQPHNDHNVGQIAFNPNANSGDPDYGLLYVAMGDGGNVCCPRPSVDPHFTGQDRSSPLGALLRIDPLADAGGAAYQIPTGNPFATDGDPDTLGEIYLYGLRNPHRFSWDTGGNGGLMISDIGQANIEEINLGQLGANYGWSEREGTFLVVHDNENDVFDLPADDATFGFTYPVIQYDHDEDDHAISGGYVYRGSQISTLLGEYVFGDLVSGRLFFASAASLDGTGQVAFEELRLIDAADGLEKSLLAIIGGGSPASRADLRFGTDDDGEIYLVTKQDGSIRLLSAPLCSGGPECADDTVSVSDISVQLETNGRKHTRASAVVTIVAETGALIEGATVHGRWSSLVDQSQSDVTDVLGEAIFRSSKVSNSLVGEFVFSVTGVVVSGLVYDPGANVDTSACINTDGDLCNTGPGDLLAPSNVSANASGDTITVSWSQVSGATGYGVYRRVGDAGDFLAQMPTTALSYVDAGLTMGTYHYVVTTLDSTTGFESGFSAIATATVNDGMPTNLRVSDIVVTLTNKGKNWSGNATVTVLDASNAPASGAVVAGQWTHEPLGGAPNDLNQVAGNTDANGRLTTTSSKLRASSGDGFRFTVNDISRGSDTYNRDASVQENVASVP